MSARPRTSAAGSVDERVAAVRAELAGWDAEQAVAALDARDVDRPLKTTVSLCPECLAHVPAIVFTRRGRVILSKRCPAHGTSEALIESDARYYRLSNKDVSGRRFADDLIFQIPKYAPPGTSSCCGPGKRCGDGTDQARNRSCTVLVEVTNACNLECRVCYSDAKGDRYLPFSDFTSFIDGLLEDKGSLESVQLTGGEATLHPRFWDMVEHLHREPRVSKVYLPTNGLSFAKDENVRRAERYKDKLMLLLQLDGLSQPANQTLRRAHPIQLRRDLIARMDRAGVPMQLTMTLARGVNEHEVGDVVDLGLDHAMVKVIALQPATWSGRFELDTDPMDRLTLSDVAKGVLERASLRAREEDWVPIPCSHPNCGWITVFLRRFGLLHNVVRYVDLQESMDEVAYKTLLSTAELRNVVGSRGRGLMKKVASFVGGKVVRSSDMFSIAIKPFMDAHSYDQDRVDNCCHHITDTRGALRSFCEYNAIGRPDDPWTRLPDLAALSAEGARALAK